MLVYQIFNNVMLATPFFIGGRGLCYFLFVFDIWYFIVSLILPKSGGFLFFKLIGSIQFNKVPM